MFNSPPEVTEFLNAIFSYGSFWVYFAICVACFIENLFPPLPGDTFILGAGALVAADRLNFMIVFPALIGSGMLSVMVLYYFGRRHGRDFFLRRNYRYFSADDVRKVEAYFGRWGASLLLISRFIMGVRSALAVVAGVSRYPVASMFVCSLISYILFAGLLMYFAMRIVENYDLIARYFAAYNMIIWPIVVIGIVWFIVHRYRKLRRRKK